ncbi:MAG: hypothetical protein KIS85_08710 [Anaerolineales bacterium]|nr:hypothetical protein [Anaerolineales bacterium]
MKSRLLNLLPPRSEKGQVIVLMALMLVGLIGAAALVVDGGRAYGERRSVQNAADSAAMAAAWALCQSPAQDHVAAARNSAQQIGLQHGADGVSVMAWSPPQSGPNAGDDEYVEVVVSAQWQPSFMQVLTADNGPQTSSARAVARCVPGSGGGGPVGWGNGLIALNPGNNNSIYVLGSGCLQVNGGGVFANSAHAEAIFVDTASGCSGGPSLQGQWVQAVGGVAFPSWVIPYGNPAQFMQPYPAQTGLAPRVDPLADLDPPTAPSQPGPAPSPTVHGSGCSNPYSGGHLNIGSGYAWCSSGITVYPGTYRSFNVATDVQVTMQPGLYYISEGNFGVAGPSSGHLNGTSGVSIYVASGDVSFGASSRATLTAESSGVLFHVHNGSFTAGGDTSPKALTGLIYVRNGGVAIGGSANITIEAPTSGSYAGMNFFMGHGNTSNFVVSGSGVLSMTGTIYAPDAFVQSSGSGSTKTVNGQIIANRFQVSGGGAALVINYDDDVVYSGGGGGTSLIELSE